MNNKKRLVILIWNMGIGGVQKRVRDIVKEISENYREWEVYLLINFKKPDNFVLPLQTLDGVYIRYFEGFFFSKRGIFSPLWVLLQLWTIKPQVALTFLDFLSVIMVLVQKVLFWRKYKLVLNEGAVTSYYLALNNRSFIWRYLVRWFYPKAQLIISPTEAGKRDLTEHFKVPPSKVRVVPNWTLFEPSGSLKRTIDLLYVGRFEEEKNALGFVEIVKLVRAQRPTLKAVMLGEGKQLRRIKLLRKRYALESVLELPGFSYETKEFMSLSKVLVLPTRNEGMPNVVLEAAMCQIPCVCSNFVGAGEVVLSGTTGFVCSSVVEMAEKAITLLNDKRLRLSMGEQAMKHVSTHFHKATQDRYIKLLLQ